MFPIAAILPTVISAAQYLLEKGLPLLTHQAAPEEAISGLNLLAALGPKAIELIEDVNNGVAPALIQERWKDAVAAVAQGNKDWEKAGAPKA